MTFDEFEAMPIIMDSFPLTFSSGQQKFTNCVIRCNDCNRPVAYGMTRGSVEKEITYSNSYRDGRNFTHYRVIAYALCEFCNKVTTAICLLHEDMTITDIHPKTKEEKRMKMRKLTRWEKFVKWYKNEK